MVRTIHPLLLASLVVGCSGSSSSSSDPTPTTTPTPTPTSEVTVTCPNSDPQSTSATVDDTTLAGLQAFVAGCRYLDWPNQGEIESSGAHGPYRTFFNTALKTALDAGQDPVPAGSATIKEIYFDDGTIDGYVVMVKTSEGSGGGTWVFFEEIEVLSEPIYGQDDSRCTRCHKATTNDHILTSSSEINR